MTSTLLTFRHFPEPRYAPKRDYSYLTEEPSITRVARALGYNPMPWQRHVWAVATEYKWITIGGQRIRFYHYPEVLISTPRQSGKTTLLIPLRVYRMMINPNGKLFSTAQSQKHASKRMLDMVDIVDQSTLGPLYKPRRGKGDAGLKFLPTHADIAQFTPNEEAIHGETAVYVDWDELWTLTKEEGDAILGGIRPSQSTFKGAAQRWKVSTKGTLASTFMNNLVDESVQGNRPQMCYMSWEMGDGLDPYDPASWWTFHPALGNTITEEFLRSEMDLPAGEWQRAYMNRLTEVQDTLMPLDDWDLLSANFDQVPARTLNDITVGFEVAPGNENAAVVGGWYENGAPIVKLIHQAPGTAWLVPYLHELRADGARRFAADGKGPVRRILDSLGDSLPVEVLGYAERQGADNEFLTAARDDGNLIHGGSKVMRIALANAQLKRTNGVEWFDRDKSTMPIPSIIAAAAALYVDSHQVVSLSPTIIV